MRRLEKQINAIVDLAWPTIEEPGDDITLEESEIERISNEDIIFVSESSNKSSDSNKISMTITREGVLKTATAEITFLEKKIKQKKAKFEATFVDDYPLPYIGNAKALRKEKYCGNQLASLREQLENWKQHESTIHENSVSLDEMCATSMNLQDAGGIVVRQRRVQHIELSILEEIEVYFSKLLEY